MIAPACRRPFPGRFPLVAAALIVFFDAAWIGPAAAPAGGVRLRYNLRAGASYEMATSMSLLSQMEMEGLPAEAAAMTAALGKDLRQDVTLKMALDVGQPDPSGGLPVEYRVTEQKMSMTMAGQPIEMPGMADLVGETILRGRLSPDGRLVEMDLEGLHGAAALPQDFKDRLLQTMPVLPDRELKIGDTFEIPAKVALPNIPGGAEIESKTIYTLRELSGASALFDLETRAAFGARSEASGVGDLHLAGGGKGSATFDMEEGIFTSVRMDMRMEVTIEMSGGPGAATPFGQAGGDANAAPAKPIRIKAVSEGPVTATMSRSAKARS